MPETRNHKKTLSWSPIVLFCFVLFFFLPKISFIQGAFKNYQGLLCKIQGLFKNIQQFFNFQGLFKAHANHGEEKSPVILFAKTGYPEHLLQSILYKKSCHNTHCCRKRSSTDSFPFKCSLINIWSYNKRRGTLESEWITKRQHTVLEQNTYILRALSICQNWAARLLPLQWCFRFQSKLSSQISQILNSMHKRNGFSAQTLGKLISCSKLTGLAMVQPASSDKWKAPLVECSSCEMPKPKLTECFSFFSPQTSILPEPCSTQKWSYG